MAQMQQLIPGTPEYAAAQANNSSLDPYLAQLSSLSATANADSGTAAQNAWANVNGAQNNLLQVNPDGYVMNGGNDTTGSALGLATYGPQSNPENNPWSGMPSPAGAGMTLTPPPQTPVNSTPANNAPHMMGQVRAVAADQTTPTTTATDTSSIYPSMPNSYGLGTGTGYSTATSGAAPYGGASTASNPLAFATPTAPAAGAGSAAAVPAASSSQPLLTTQGFNPWSMTGEANSRQK